MEGIHRSFVVSDCKRFGVAGLSLGRGRIEQSMQRQVQIHET